MRINNLVTYQHLICLHAWRKFYYFWYNVILLSGSHLQAPKSRFQLQPTFVLPMSVSFPIITLWILLQTKAVHAAGCETFGNNKQNEVLMKRSVLIHPWHLSHSVLKLLWRDSKQDRPECKVWPFIWGALGWQVKKGEEIKILAILKFICKQKGWFIFKKESQQIDRNEFKYF